MRKLIVIAIAATLGACTVGPNYVKPDHELPQQFAEAQRETFERQQPVSAVWSAFGDPVLDSLIARAQSANTTMAQALARLNEQRALRGLSIYSWFPTVTAAASGDRSKPSGRDPFLPPDQGTTDTYRAGFDAAWEIDIFGSLRREFEQQRRIVEAEEANLVDVHQSVVAETAQAYFALRGAQERLRLQRKNLENLGENVQVLGDQRDAGRGTDLDVAQARALQLSVAAQMPQVEAEIARQEQRLAVLTAQTIDVLREQLGEARPLPTMPQLVAVGTPQDWISRRPDVRVAERRLAAATAGIGVQVAEFFPKLNLLGGFGWTSQRFGDLGKSSTERWNYGPSLSWSFLDFGRVRQRVKAAEARADGAVAAYHETVLRALEDTENALAGYRAANESTQALEEAVKESRTAAELAHLRFDNGASDWLVVLDAERSLIDFEDRYAQAATQRATALAALYKALVGDFARAADPADGMDEPANGDDDVITSDADEAAATEPAQDAPVVANE
jgi:multidrug efflux system outer membrane protein